MGNLSLRLSEFLCINGVSGIILVAHWWGEVTYLHSLYWKNIRNILFEITVPRAGVVSSIPARYHTFVEIDHEIISTAILLPSADSRRVGVCYKRKYVHEVQVSRLVKFAQEKSVIR